MLADVGGAARRAAALGIDAISEAAKAAEQFRRANAPDVASSLSGPEGAQAKAAFGIPAAPSTKIDFTPPEAVVPEPVAPVAAASAQPQASFTPPPERRAPQTRQPDLTAGLFTPSTMAGQPQGLFDAPDQPQGLFDAPDQRRGGGEGAQSQPAQQTAQQPQGLAGMTIMTPEGPMVLVPQHQAYGQQAQAPMGQQMNENEQRIYQKLVQRGMPDHIARGFVMNFANESGLNASQVELAPNRHGTRGFGLYQLTDTAPGVGRRSDFMRFSAQNGLDPNSEDAQLDFLMHELNTSERGARDAIFSTATAGQAGAAIVRTFLRPAAEHRERRTAKYLSYDAGPAQPAVITQASGDGAHKPGTRPDGRIYGDGDPPRPYASIPQDQPTGLVYPDGSQQIGQPDEQSFSVLAKNARGGGARPDAIAGLRPNFAGNLAALTRDAEARFGPGALALTSGYRSVTRQRELYENGLRKYGTPEATRKWVAPPGGSSHNFGNAADLGYSNDDVKRWVHENARRYGLQFRLSNEDWHIEPIDRNNNGGGQTMFAAAPPAAAPQAPAPQPAAPLTVAAQSGNLGYTQAPAGGLGFTPTPGVVLGYTQTPAGSQTADPVRQLLARIEGGQEDAERARQERTRALLLS